MRTGSVVAAWGESVCCGFVKKLVVGVEKVFNKETECVCMCVCCGGTVEKERLV